MIACTRCGRENPDYATFCIGCAGRLRLEESAKEVEHIAYVLAEIPRWVARGWITHPSAQQLAADYARRRYELAQRMEPSFVVPPVYAAPGPAAPAPEQDWRAEREARVAPFRQASPVPPSPLPETASAPEASAVPLLHPDREEPGIRAPWLSEFLESHWQKLLALLGVVLVFVGMRHLLGWEWVSVFARTLIPLIPIGLTATFFYFGLRYREQRAIGAFAYCATAIVLAAFCVFSVNKHWLGSALAPPQSYLLGILASTLMAAYTLFRTRDPGFLHLLLGGVAATLYAALQVAVPTPLFAPSPAWLYAAAFLLLALGCMSAARLLWDAEGDALAVSIVEPLTLWAHLFATAALARVTLPALAGTGASGEAAALLAGGTLLYAVCAQWFRSAPMAYAASGLAAGTAALLIRDRAGADLYAWGFAMLLLSVAALGMSAFNRSAAQNEEESPLAIVEAYGHMALTAGALAGVMIFARVLVALSGINPLIGPDWPRGVLLAGLCAALYALFAVRLRQPAVLYASVTASAFAMVLAVNRLLPAVPALSPHLPAHDLLPFAVLALALGTMLRGLTREDEPAAAMDWGAPFHHASLLAAIVGLAAAIGHGITDKVSPGLWTALLPCGLLCLAGAWTTREEPASLLARAWAGGALASVTACTGFLAAWHTPGAPWTSILAAGTALSVLAWVYFGLAQALHDSPQSALWRDPLRVGAGLSALLGALLALGGSDGAALWMLPACTLALGLSAAMALAEQEEWPLLAGLLVLVPACARLWIAAPATGHLSTLASVAFALAAAALYGISAWRLDRSGPVWLSIASLALAGAAGALFGHGPALYARATAELAALSLAAGAAGLGMAAAWSRRPGFSAAAGIAGLVAYLRFLTLLFEVDLSWAAMGILPALFGLVAAARLLRGNDESLFCRPLQRVTLAAAYIALALSAASALLSGADAFYAGAVTLLCYAILFGVAAFGQPSVEKLLATTSAGLLVGGWLFALAVPPGSHAADVATVLLVLASGACAALYAWQAWRTEDAGLGYAAGLAACAAFGAVVTRVLPISRDWWALAGLPCLAVLYTLGRMLRTSGETVLGAPLRHTALGVSLAALAGSLVFGLERPTETTWITTGTFAAYGLAYMAALAGGRAPVWSGLASSAFTLAYGYRLATLSPAWTPPHWAAAFVCAGAFWLLVARALDSREDLKPIAAPVYGLAAVVAAVGGAVGLAQVTMPDQGVYTVVALALAGTIYAGLYLLRQEDGYAHAGFLCYLLAYGLFLYDRISIHPGVLDLYMIPVGLYLLVLGHVTGKRGTEETAGALWWVGLLTTMTPTFFAFYHYLAQGGTQLHALLLLAECTGAIGWGIANRIKAFVFAGTLFALAFAVVMAGSAGLQVVPGAFALALGLALLVFVYYLSVNQEMLRRWMSRMGEEWRQWR